MSIATSRRFSRDGDGRPQRRPPGGSGAAFSSRARPGGRLLGWVLLGALLAGCSGIKVRSDYDPTADFSTLRTYAWLPTPRAKTGDPRIDDPLINARIERAIDRAVAAKGFARVETEQADFHVTFYIGIDRKLDVTTMPRSYGYYGRWGGFYGGTTTYVDQYDVGTLLIDVIDRGRNELVWRGVGETRLRQSRTPQESEQRIQQTVDAVLKDFPPGRVAP